MKTSKHIQISTSKRCISSLELVFMEECVMKQVNCPICGSKCVWYVLDSRSKMTLFLLFSKIPREERTKIKYVTIDMWEPYKDVARTYFPIILASIYLWTKWSCS